MCFLLAFYKQRETHVLEGGEEHFGNNDTFHLLPLGKTSRGWGWGRGEVYIFGPTILEKWMVESHEVGEMEGRRRSIEGLPDYSSQEPCMRNLLKLN